MSAERIIDTKTSRGHVVKLLDAAERPIIKYAIEKNRGRAIRATFGYYHGDSSQIRRCHEVLPRVTHATIAEAVEFATRECERIRTELGGGTGAG